MASLNKKTNILIVDDNIENLIAIEAILQSLDQHIIRTQSGREALKQILQQDFSVILMDVHMPDMDGFETAKLIRMRDKSRYTPIIFISALHKDDEAISQGYAMGAVDYIFKPINANILRCKVKVFVDLYIKAVHTKTLQEELTKRLQAEKALKQLTYKTQTILESAGDGIFGINSKGIITFANPAAAKILDLTIDHLVKQSIQTILPLEKNKLIAWQNTAFYKVIHNKNTLKMQEAQFRSGNGDLIPVEYTVTPKQEYTKEKKVSAVVVFKDIVERKKAEALAQQHHHQLELANNAKITAMEEVASALAHELNQPLSAIANYNRGCIIRLKSGTIQHKELISVMQQVAQQSERAGEIIHRIKNFARKGQLYFEAVSINQVIKTVVSLLDYEITKAKVKIKFELDTKLPVIRIDKIQIEQVILNLLRNSIEAMCEHSNPKPLINIRTVQLDEDKFSIDVLDNGPGFPAEILPKLFEPYFTTKAQGMGIGLSICRTIIEAHRGQLSAKENPTGGAWLECILPIVSIVENNS